MKKSEINMLVAQRTATLVTTAFGLVAALAWNEAIKAVFKEIFGTADTPIPMVVYAVIVTVIAVLVTLWMNRYAAEK